MNVDPDRACPHDDLNALVEVIRLQDVEGGPIVGFTTHITVSCSGCGEPFRWIGVQAGSMPDRPMVSPDERELRAPIRPASSDPDFGLGLPGYAIGLREPLA